jgi:hypothetical protein
MLLSLLPYYPTAQLYHYGFERCKQGAFSHPLFQRDDEYLSGRMGRKIKDDECHNSTASTFTKREPPPSPRKDHNSAGAMGQDQQLQLRPRMALLSSSNFDPLPLSYSNIYIPPFKSATVVSTTQDAITVATELSVLLLEPRPIEEMSADPWDFDEFFADTWPIEV